MDKEDVMYIYNGILLSHKKEWSFAICNNLDGLVGYYAKWNNSDKERQILYNITLYVESKKIQQNTNRLTDIENKLVVTSGEREERRGIIRVGDWEVQTTMYEINKQQGYIVQCRGI